MLQCLSYTAAGLESSGDEQLELYPSLFSSHAFISLQILSAATAIENNLSAEPSKIFKWWKDGFAVLKPHVISVIPFPEHPNVLY